MKLEPSSGKFSDNPPRPSIGTSGTPITVSVNIFPIRAIAEIKAFQYDVVIEPDLPPNNLRALWHNVFEPHIQSLNSGGKKPFLVFDGKKNCFSTFDFGGEMGEKFEYEIEFDKNSYDENNKKQQTSTRAGEKFKIQLKKVSTILFHDLLQYTKGLGPETSTSLHAMTCLSTVLNHLPSIMFTPVGSNFFTPKDKARLGGGLEVWRGYHQSIRSLMAGHLGVNVDIASTVFREGSVPLIDLAMQALGARDVRDLARMNSRRLLAEIKGINVVTTHRGDIKHRFKVSSISDVPASEYRFEVNNVSTTIIEYFQQTYNIAIKYPELPVVFKGNKKTGFPMELLKVAPAQRFMKRLNGQQVSDMIKAVNIKPAERRNKIERAIKETLGYSQDPYLESFGLEVSSEMMSVPARSLPAPTVVFANNRTTSGRDGVWNLRDVKLCSAPPLTSVAFVFFVRIDRRKAEEIRDSLLDKWRMTGVNVSVSPRNVPILVEQPNDYSLVLSVLKRAFSEANSSCGSRCQMLVCIIDKEPKNLYEDIKRITLTEAGVLSQCLQFRHIRNEVKAQYAANVAMKVNIKLGGATNIVDKLPGFDRPTMLVGADVTHAHAGSTSPSVVALVSSMDKNCTRYNTFLRAQGSRVELIDDMEALIGQALDRFKEAVSIYPEQIVFFRDGVAAGQFSAVREQEIGSMKKALLERGLETKCKIIFLIVQKRHHIRLFPKGGQEDRSGNCRPGTVIDNAIMHPFEYNFILQSHSGIQGTSRPCIYHVVYDEIKWTPDVLQQLCYNLCFLSERATRSISMVAPAYRAHIAAFYGRMFIDGDSSDVASMRSGDKETPIRLKNVTEAISRTMYYM